MLRSFRIARYRKPRTSEFNSLWIADIEASAGHVWVVAPPFELVDVVLGSQPYTRGEERLVPHYLVTEQPSKTITPQATDHCSTDLLLREHGSRGPLSTDIHFEIIPGLHRVADFFPSFEVKLDAVTLRYAVAGISLSQASSLYSVSSHRWNGKLAGELYDYVVKPELDRS